MTAIQKTNQAARASRDLRAGLGMHHLWLSLGWNDIKQRYRRSMLGPFWLTISMAIMVTSLGVVYAQILRVDLNEFLPFLCVGILIWGLISSILTESGTVFIGAEAYIKQVRLPYSLYVLRFIWGNLIIFAHNFLIYVVILLYFAFNPGIVALASTAGIVLIVLNGIFASVFIGMMSARFRDIPQIVTSLVQVIFFITPILWKPELLGHRSYIADWNPFFHLIEIVRAPLLGGLPSLTSYLAAVLITVINGVIGALAFTRFRARISYWV